MNRARALCRAAAAGLVGLVVVTAGATSPARAESRQGEPPDRPVAAGEEGQEEGEAKGEGEGAPPSAPQPAPAPTPPAAPAPAPAPAASSRVAEIRVQGNRKTEAEAIRAQIRSRVGAPLDPAIVSEDVRRIYSLGFFQDVRVDLDETPEGAVLTYVVEEKPAIREIRYEGNDKLSEDDLKGVVNLRPFAILDVAAVKRNVQKIKDLYTEKGYFLAEVGHEIRPVGPNEVDVVFVIRENARVLVRRIEILGNEKVPDRDIKDVMLTREGGYFSFLTSAGTFRQDVLERDAMMVSSLYFDRGFINARVDRPILDLSPDREGIYISLRVTEGDPYSVSSLDVQGDLVVPREKILETAKLRPGDVFNRTRLFSDIEAISDIYRDQGYAYVNVTPLTRTDDVKDTIAITLDIQKGNKVRFGRIEIRGNLRTRDKVIRRELEIFEGDEYSATAIKESRRNVLRLGFFDNVEITTHQTEKPDVIDVEVAVTERQTGSFQLGVGFSSLESFIGTAQISESNLFGRGQTVSLMATLSGVRQYVNFRFYEPRFLDSKWSASFSLSDYELAYDDFVRGDRGGDVSLGYWLTDDLNVSLTYGYHDVDVQLRNQATKVEEGATSSVRGVLVYDTRNNRLLPTEGLYGSASVEYAPSLLGSDNLFTRYQFQTRFYQPLPLDLVFKAAARYGIVVSNSDRDVPLSERFFVGGINSVRGFDRASLGPRLRMAGRTPDAPLSLINAGGTQELVFNFEIEFPIFKEVGIRGVVFTDFGQAFDRRDAVLLDPDLLLHGDATTDGLRGAFGLGFRWFSPLGPLRFEWGFPYNPRPGEDAVVFEFTIGDFL